MVFLGKVFRHVLLLSAALDQFFAVEFVLVKILGVQKSKSANWRIFLKVSESLLMVLATTFVPCSLLGIGYVCYDSHQEKYSTKYFFRCLVPRLHSRKQVEAHFTALEVLINKDISVTKNVTTSSQTSKTVRSIANTCVATLDRIRLAGILHL